jgi:hypothetical protein
MFKKLGIVLFLLIAVVGFSCSSVNAHRINHIELIHTMGVDGVEKYGVNYYPISKELWYSLVDYYNNHAILVDHYIFTGPRGCQDHYFYDYKSIDY